MHACYMKHFIGFLHDGNSLKLATELRCHVLASSLHAPDFQCCMLWKVCNIEKLGMNLGTRLTHIIASDVRTEAHMHDMSLCCVILYSYCMLAVRSGLLALTAHCILLIVWPVIIHTTHAWLADTY